MMHTVEAQPAMVFPRQAMTMAQMIPIKPMTLTTVPNPVMIEMGFTERLVMPSIASASILRSGRETDTFFKRFTAQSFYKILKSFGAEILTDHADYRLVSSEVLEAFSDFREVNLFLRGMFPLVGYRSERVYYKRNERMAGESHYPLKKMIRLAIDGITSFSVKPIRIITAIGFAASILGFIGIIWAIIAAVMNRTVAGWTSMVCIVCLLSGIQLLSLGVIGEYIGKIYMETKQRPRYIIHDRKWEERKKKDKG